MSQKPSVLVVDDESGILDTLRILLRNEGFEVTTAQGGKAGLEQIRTGAHDLVLTDVRMPQVTGLDILNAAREQDPMTPVILMTAQASLQSAIQAVNAGAFYYIQKPFSNDELVAILRRACEYRQLRVENKQLKQEIRRRDKTAVARPIGKSKRFLERAEAGGARGADRFHRADPGRERHRQGSHRPLHPQPVRPRGRAVPLDQLRRAAGEPAGERAVRAREGLVHRRGARQAGPLRRGARAARFFLDEIGEMPPSLQVKLLRVLQEREVIPVGATEAIPVDVRIIAATNRDLEEEIRRGNFRSDLFYRLNVIALHLPAAARAARRPAAPAGGASSRPWPQEAGTEPKALSSEALDAVMVYDWPGNVRELENALEHAVVLSRGNLIEAGALPERITKRRKEPLVAERSYRNPTLEVIERAYIMWVLQAEGGNKTRAAEVLGIDPSTLYRKLSRYEEQVEVKA